MVTAVHTLVHADHDEATRAFLRDVLQEHPWGHTIRVQAPGAGAVTVDEPTYDPPATSL